MKVAILNDTADGRLTGGGHFGCQLVMETFQEQFERVGAEVVQSIPSRLIPATPIRDDVDLVVVNGEGSIHHNRHPELVKIASEYPSVLLNCVWQDNLPYKELKDFKLVTVRESFSQKEMSVDCEVIPDIIFASKRLNAHSLTPKYDIGITDNVLNQRQGGDGGFSAIQPVDKYLNEMVQYQRLCVGRFHSAIAASVLGIPFSTWPSNTHKIQGMMHDMDLSHHHYDTKQQALDNCPKEVDNHVSNFVPEAQQKITNLFDRIAML